MYPNWDIGNIPVGIYDLIEINILLLKGVSDWSILYTENIPTLTAWFFGITFLKMVLFFLEIWYVSF